MIQLFREDDGFLNSLSAPAETKDEKLIRTGLKNPFEVKYEEHLRLQLKEKGHDELLQYHDPDNGSDSDFEEPNIGLIEEHVANKPLDGGSDSDDNNNKESGIAEFTSSFSLLAVR